MITTYYKEHKAVTIGVSVAVVLGLGAAIKNFNINLFTDTIKVTSENNQGNIVGKGNINIVQHANIELTDADKERIANARINKDSTITVSREDSAGPEMAQFAKDMKLFLTQQGYKNVKGVDIVWMSTPSEGWTMQPKSATQWEISIGSFPLNTPP